MTPIRQGMVTVNEEKGIRSFLWSKKWMVLKEQSLSFHKNEVSLGEFRLMSFISGALESDQRDDL
jgi:hypothetical protein